MSITISIRSSQTGKPQPKTGIAGALGMTEPEGSFDESVEITIDEGHQVSDLEQVLDAGARAATTAFSISFRPQGIIEFVDEPAEAEKPEEGDIEAPHICGPECGLTGTVEIFEATDPEDLLDKLRESIERARALRKKRDAEATELKGDD